MLKPKQKGFRARFGRAFPKIIEDLPKRSLAELQGIWLNLVPHLAGRNVYETSALAVQLRDAILQEWADRSKLAADDPQRFPWPSTDAPLGIGRLSSGADWQQLGMLAFLGYHVGASHGLTQNNRQAILDTAYLAALPPLNGPSYMAEWGKPETADRLKKISFSLAAFARNAKRRSSASMGLAIRNWEEDLGYLKRHYYDSRYSFSWPMILHP